MSVEQVCDWLDEHPGRYCLCDIVKGTGLSRNRVVVSLVRVRKRVCDYGFCKEYVNGRPVFVYWSKR